MKALLLFFDQIAILRPRYMSGIERLTDPVLAAPLLDMGLLKVLEPEVFVDQQMTEDLATAMVSLLTSGTFDDLDRSAHFHELSQSRVGWGADIGLATMLTEELVGQGLARPARTASRFPCTLRCEPRFSSCSPISLDQQDAGRAWICTRRRPKRNRRRPWSRHLPVAKRPRPATSSRWTLGP